MINVYVVSYLLLAGVVEIRCQAPFLVQLVEPKMALKTLMEEWKWRGGWTAVIAERCVSAAARVDAIPLSFLRTNSSWQEAVILRILSVKEYG